MSAPGGNLAKSLTAIAILPEKCAVKGRYDTLGDMAVAMAYVPWQMWRNVLDVEKGLCCGTIFEDLNKPFCGTGGVRR